MTIAEAKEFSKRITVGAEADIDSRVTLMEWLGVVKKALDAKEAKEVIINNTYGDLVVFECPTCAETRATICKDPNKNSYDYCPRCGQMLSWFEAVKQIKEGKA